uniref:Probable arginine--tRNA ligase, cytoplasmic n=1 Tax=Phlebotomus papatasi TaxID=29031 RepID=A0A1B0DG19_PHLPP
MCDKSDELFSKFQKMGKHLEVITDRDSGHVADPRWVLTSAHCGGLSNAGIAILGAHEVQSPLEFGQVRMTFTNIVRHPHWNPDNFANDIALVELEHNVDFTWRIQAARLPSIRNVNSNWFNQRTLVSGWGSRKDTISTQHRYIRAQVQSRITCTVSYPTLFHSTSLCTPGNDRSPCQGDSGAGLSIVESDGQKTTIGILSFGSGLVAASAAILETPQTIPEDILADPVQPKEPDVISTTINWNEVLPVWNTPTFFDWFPILRRILTRDRDSEWNGYILGGSIAQPGQFPETVALLFNLPMAHAFCGGTLVSNLLYSPKKIRPDKEITDCLSHLIGRRYNDIAMDLENEIRSMSDVGTSNGVDCEDEELTKLVVENQSLKHRLHILNKAIAGYKTTVGEVKVNSQFSILNHLTDIFRDALSRLYEGEFVDNVTMAATNNAKFGDYQFNSAMTIAKIFKDRGIGKNPREIAMEVMKELRQSEIVEKFEVAGAGFINIFLKR